MGLKGMRGRVHQLDGTLIVESDGAGTRVLVTIPIRKDALRKAERPYKLLSGSGA